jgi:Protein of unknown function (DUF3551)
MLKTLSAVLGAAVIAAALFSTPTQSRAVVFYPWCVQYGGGHHGIDAVSCGFVSYQQCMMTARGTGDFCLENPAYPAEPRTSRHTHRGSR